MPAYSMIAQLQRRVGRFPIELPAAAALAVAIAFLTMSLPDWRFERAVAATGLGNVLSAAQPPLGATARIVAALALAALSFLAAWFGLRALDEQPEAGDFPAFRAADLHPDAPRRRPILAGAEFGAPADEPAAPTRRRALVSEPLPSFLAPQPPQIADLVPAPELFPAKKKRDDTEDEWLADSRNEMDAFPEPALEAATHEDAAPVAEVPSFLQASDDDVPFQRPNPADRNENVWSADQPAFPEAVEQAPDSDDETSVANLMARLESGVARHGGRPPKGAAGSTQDELRRALGDLDRVSDRRG